jgi:wyosine [tRNA(Phe)-imidazoG37] synthetase (radical SAM superfamily)
MAGKGPTTLDVRNHDRDAAGLRYVYPVVSRRAGGVSLGVNLNPNNACNWRCVYCQVPDLRRGAGPAIDLDRLERELRGLLDDVVHGDFMQRRVPEWAQRLNDVSFSGNGEPTSSPQFAESVALVGRVLDELGLLASVKPILISNGSLIARAGVVSGIERLAELGGEVWFKLDAGTDAELERINSTPIRIERHLARLERCARLCPTWVQTCVFAWRGEPPSESWQRAYLDCLRTLVRKGANLRGVHLYGIARTSQQPEAAEIDALPDAWLRDLARRIARTGLQVRQV